MKGIATELYSRCFHYLTRALPARSRISLVGETYKVVERSLGAEDLEVLRRNCLSKVFQGVRGGVDPTETWQTRKYAFERYMDRFTVLSSFDIARIYGFIALLDSLREVPGDIVECGVGYGKSLTILVFGVSLLDLERTVHGFDSFFGFPMASVQDLGPRVTSVTVPDGWTETSPQLIEAILETDRLREDSLLRKRPVTLKLVPGFFPDTLPEHLPDEIAFLHVDCDLYESTRVVLEQCLPRMSSGGALVFDEYQEPKWPGATKAVDEICSAWNLELTYFQHVQRYGLRML
jgi:hypothetical protein